MNNPRKLKTLQYEEIEKYWKALIKTHFRKNQYYTDSEDLYEKLKEYVAYEDISRQAVLGIVILNTVLTRTGTNLNPIFV
jgi:hypothetical protein